MVVDTSLYDELGILPSAATDEIRAAYRRLALKYHPDKNGGDARAAEKFKKVAEAYEILSDPTKRRHYDQLGKASAAGQNGPSAANFPFGSVDAEELFRRFFGVSTGGGSSGGPPSARKPPDIVIELQLSLEELYCGTRKRVAVRRVRRCPHCKGHGTSDQSPLASCQLCGGRGQRVHGMRVGGLVLQQMQVCSSCNGTGKTALKHPCKHCFMSQHSDNRVVGTVECVKELLLEVDPGTDNEARFRFHGEGDEMPPPYQEPGDIIITTKALPHPHYRRISKNDLLLLNCVVPLESVFQKDFFIPIEHLDGRILKIFPAEGTCAKMNILEPLFPHCLYSVANKGMPIRGDPQGRQGKLFVRIHVVYPRALNVSQLTLLEEAFRYHLSDMTEPPQGKFVCLNHYSGNSAPSQKASSNWEKEEQQEAKRNSNSRVSISSSTCQLQ
ncbi:putative heat shock protein DNAJ [Trypanosoma cruzi]|uniref:Putative heat shock protein DNAJ n=1 Tax=Trypanosoma cruzi TaxID=5693 RepID=A0A2V2W214_TRYCR|nr:putative heat shock protein DNAJ [Trypanosoma cruzi]